MKAVLISSILVLTVASSYGLDCYDCFFHQGITQELPPSDPDCENNPKTVVTCDMTNLSSVNISRSRNKTSKGNGRADVFTCFTFSGKSSDIANISFVQRGCFNIDEMYANQCDKYSGYIDMEPVAFEECFCTTDKCNGKYAGEDETSGQSVISGAGFIIISCLSLFAKVSI